MLFADDATFVERLGPPPPPVVAVPSGFSGFGAGGDFTRDFGASSNAFADITSFTPEDLDFVELLKLRPLSNLTLRPTGVPWFLPGELGTNRYGVRPGPGIGFDTSWMPSPHWRFGADLIVRADRMDSNNQLHDWTPYLAPGMEFIPYPRSKRPFSIGFVAPIALRERGENWSGYFLVLRWEEVLEKAAKHRR